jgi:hypothetical protein
MKTVKTLTLLTICVASIALADDFKTINGKEYKNATVSRVEPDGILVKTKSGISKVYFTELPKEVQERFHYNPADVAQFSAAAKSNAVPPQEQTPVVRENVRTMREVSTDQPNFLDRPFLLKGTINVDSYYNFGYDEAQRTRYAFRIVDSTGSDCPAYMERSKAANLHQQLIEAGHPLRGVFSVVLLSGRYDRLAGGQLLLELFDYRIDQ